MSLTVDKKIGTIMTTSAIATMVVIQPQTALNTVTTIALGAIGGAISFRMSKLMLREISACGMELLQSFADAVKQIDADNDILHKAKEIQKKDLGQFSPLINKEWGKDLPKNIPSNPSNPMMVTQKNIATFVDENKGRTLAFSLDKDKGTFFLKIENNKMFFYDPAHLFIKVDEQDDLAYVVFRQLNAYYGSSKICSVNILE